MRYILCFLICSFCFTLQPAFADETNAAPDLSSLKRTGASTVVRIIDGLTILLKDENIIRLSTLDIPGAPNDPDNIHAINARDALQTLLPSGTQITLYQTRKAKIGRENRMGHTLAHILRQEDNLWINGALVENAHARVLPTASNAEMTDTLYDLENKAIQASKGIWAAEHHPVYTTDTIGDALGTVAVLEGIPVKAATVRNALYLNFGANWKTDFTVKLSTQIRKKMARAGIDPKNLAGQKIRVRGFVRSYNGPFIDLAHEDHLQVLSVISPLQPAAEIPTINPNP